MHKLVRISVSKLDSHRFWLTNQYINKSLDDYLYEIENGSEESDAMRRGTLLHGVLENGIEEGVEEVRYKNQSYRVEQLQDLIEWRKANPMNTEVVLPPYYIECDAGWRIALSGRVDGVNDRVHDHKFPKKASCKFESYFDSLQWRYYLEMTDMSHFQYNIFVDRGRGKDKVVRLHRIYRMHREPNAKGFLEDFAREYFRFLMDYGLETKLRNAQVEKILT